MFAMDENCVNALLELVYHPAVDLNVRDWKGRSLEEVARFSQKWLGPLKWLLFTGPEDLLWEKGLWLKLAGKEGR